MNLINKSKEISKNFNKQELDVLLASGEQVIKFIISWCINRVGVNQNLG